MSGPANGAFGFLDQQLALKFVRDNIGAFKGDKDSIIEPVEPRRHGNTEKPRLQNKNVTLRALLSPWFKTPKTDLLISLTTNIFATL